ncbi:hypothetical protein [Deinococcus roseus]|nr:hypothetical protein [Deinococcus roseus]
MEETMDTRVLRDLGDRELVLYASRDVGATVTRVTFRLKKKASGPFNVAQVSWGYSCDVLYDPASPDWKVFGRLKGTFTDSSDPTMQGNMLLPGDKSACEVTRVQP